MWIRPFLFLVAAAACAADAVRPITERIRIDSNVVVQMRDGIKLYADVYRPDREGRFPALVVRTPYGKQRDGMHETKLR
ncbi:MAG: hypothetical protein JNN08_20175, partial [Bryobacterales bacterium]|nr:hypothetical protein [Bryobacterales bacterium]